MLLTRARGRLVAAGELKESRLYDVRAYKSSLLVLSYVHRLAHAQKSGQLATAMTQLVTGLSRERRHWKMSGDRFDDRDAHQAYVRRSLNVLTDMGLLRWGAGVNDDGEERRTELILLTVPVIDAGELQQARARMSTWGKRYGPALNTGGRFDLKGYAKTVAPLTPPEREQRARRRALALRLARRRGDISSISAPPFGSPTTPEYQHPLSPFANSGWNPCGTKTGVTRTRATVDPVPSAAVKTSEQRAGEESGSGGVGLPFDEAVLLARVSSRTEERAVVFAAIAAGADRRARELAGWGRGRGWPVGRVREAWVVARHGADAAARTGAAAAGQLRAEDEARLRRAVARYDRHADSRPEGMPAGGLAALLELAATRGSQWLGHDVLALDRLSKQMRAATATSPARLEKATARAERRWQPAPEASLQLRLAGGPVGPWPAWVILYEDGRPRLENGRLLVDRPPPESSPEYRQVLRDAHLLAGLVPPAEVDGPQERDLRARGVIPPAQRPGRRDAEEAQADREITELHKLTEIPLSGLRQLDPGLRAAMLTDARKQHHRRQAAEQQAFLERIRDNRPKDGR